MNKIFKVKPEKDIVNKKVNGFDNFIDSIIESPDFLRTSFFKDERESKESLKLKNKFKAELKNGDPIKAIDKLYRGLFKSISNNSGMKK